METEDGFLGESGLNVRKLVIRLINLKIRDFDNWKPVLRVQFCAPIFI